MRQTEYTVQDLVQDPSFLRFAKGIASVEETEEWDRWIEHTLQNRAKSKAAISEIVGFEFKNELAPDIEKQWALLYKKTAGDQKKESRRLTGRELNWIVRAVAVLILVSTVWAGSHLFSNDGMPVTQLEQLIEETTLRTAENEQKIMRFSNGSSIVLNSNSTITYSTGQVNSQTIQVFLDGEAWFVADDDPGLPGPAFSISTPNGIIEDIGTEFLVSVGDTGSRVVVQEGVVEIFPSRHQADFNPPNYKEISSYRAEKGELIEFTHENILDRRNVNTTFYTSWATGFMQHARHFQAIIKRDERLIYFFDQTDQVELETLYRNEKTVLGIIFLDNYEELTQAMDDTSKSQLNSQMTSLLNQWSSEHNIYLKRTSQERFLAVMNLEILDGLEKTKFGVLDEVREMITDKNIPLTISIGIGIGKSSSLREIGELAQSSLDLALGRGGDQVAIKDELGQVRFYGGKTNPMEKRTRVRARVISHALMELVKASDHVVIMGHKNPDMDSIGSAIGILKIVQANGKNGYVVYDENGMNSGVQKLTEMIEKDEQLAGWFINNESAYDIVTDNTLVVVVDTHKPSLVIDDRLLSKTNHVVVIDHHRRAEEFINDPTLVYMEPYASSTAELVTELLEYQPSTLKLNILESTALLAGIIVDTKYFTLRTGSRTFDAASYLRSKGADTVLVQQLMKEDIEVYIRRSKLIEKAEVFEEGIAIIKAEAEESYDPILIAQAADALLSMNGVKASFVISNRADGRVGISARSLGEVNVQIIMEQMNGGGHLSNAATQLEDITVEEAYTRLKEILKEYIEGREQE